MHAIDEHFEKNWPGYCRPLLHVAPAATVNLLLTLHDLEAWWITANERVVGVAFLCPHCQNTNIGVLFQNPPDGGPPHPADESIPGNNEGLRWHREGETFFHLTIRPSIDASSTGHWHGFVSSGLIA